MHQWHLFLDELLPLGRIDAAYCAVRRALDASLIAQAAPAAHQGVTVRK
jgi:hypothetical protein